MKRTAACSMILLAAFLFSFIHFAFAESKKDVTEVIAEGRYVMGDLDSRKDAKAMALMEAKRMALEKAGTYVESLSEVKDYQLTKDQINSLAAGVMSVEILKEDWSISGENMAVVIKIRAVIDASNLKSRIAAIQNEHGSENSKDIQNQLMELQKELADLKAQQASVKEKNVPASDFKEKHDTIIKQMSALEYLESGNAALLSNNWNGAVAAFSNALSLDPNLSDAYAGMSIAFLKTGEKEKAGEAVNKALILAPQSSNSHNAKAMLLFEQRKYREALASINKAIELKPTNPRLYLFRGEIYMQLRQYEFALRDFDRACKMRLPRACQRAETVRQNQAPKRNIDDKPQPKTPQYRRPLRYSPPIGR